MMMLIKIRRHYLSNIKKIIIKQSLIKGTQLFNYYSTIDTQEIEYFRKITGPNWWCETGPMKALHSLNKLRVPFIRDGIINTNNNNGKKIIKCTAPLEGSSILEVGCGGGILTEPLARLGAKITGLDPSPDVIQEATAHAVTNNNNNSIEYVAASIEDYVADEKKDAIVISEVLEHVTNKVDFLVACVNCLRPNGSIFITTINKNWWANVCAIYVAEYLLDLVPRGTHDYEKFIEPHCIQRILEDCNCKTILIHGLHYNACTNNWTWSSDKSINYALQAVKLP